MYYMQLVTPSDVQSAVSTVTMTCRIVFQVSFFIFFIPFFLVNNLVSVSGHPSLGRGMIHLFVSEPHQWFSLTMQRYNIFGRNAIVVPAVESACPGSCDVRHEIPFDRAAVSCVATQEILRGDVVIATWRRRNYDVATQEKGRGGGGIKGKGEKVKVKRWNSQRYQGTDEKNASFWDSVYDAKEKRNTIY